MVHAKCKYADSKSSAYLRGTCMVENKGVPDRNIDRYRPVRKYANYRTLSSHMSSINYGHPFPCPHLYCYCCYNY